MPELIARPNPHAGPRNVPLHWTGLAHSHQCDLAALGAPHPQASEPVPSTSDWAVLASSKQLYQLSAVPIQMGGQLIGVLTLGVDSAEAANAVSWPMYMNIVTSTINCLIKDNVLKYMQVRAVCKTCAFRSMMPGQSMRY